MKRDFRINKLFSTKWDEVVILDCLKSYAKFGKVYFENLHERTTFKFQPSLNKHIIFAADQFYVKESESTEILKFVSLTQLWVNKSV